MSKAKDDGPQRPQLTYTLPQYIRAMNTTPVTFYKVPPEQRPPFRRIYGKNQILIAEAIEHAKNQPLATWDDLRGVNLRRRGRVAV